MSEDLFGNTVADEPAKEAKKPRETNNMDTIIAVLKRAVDKDAGYALLGPVLQVHRCGPKFKGIDPEATLAIWWEAVAVHQLINSGLVTTGGQHTYATRHGTKTGRALLVPKSTRAMLARWTALVPLPTKTKA